MSSELCGLCEEKIDLNSSATIQCESCFNPIHVGCADPSRLNQDNQFYCKFCPLTLQTPADRLPNSNFVISEPTYSHKRQASPLTPTKSQTSKLPRIKMALNDSTAPEWFIRYQNEARSHLDARFAALHTDIDTRLTAIETKLNTDSEEIRGEVKSIRTDFNNLSQSLINVDTCELKISGLPSTPDKNTEQVVHSIFCALGFNGLISQVIYAREWIDKPGSSTAAQSNSPVTWAAVVKMTSSTIRDLVLSRKPKLRDLTAQQILGTGGDGKIFISPLYPPDVYQLSRKARLHAKNIGYVPPVIRNLTVCMRQSRTSPLIPIHSENDLMSLPPIHTVSTSYSNQPSAL